MENAFSFKEITLPKGPTIEAVHLFLLTDRMHRRAIEANLSALGIHRSQHRLLLHLSRCGGAASQKELAGYLQISPAAVAVTVKKLEKNKLLRRTVSKEDGRCKGLVITPLGKEVLERSYQAFSKTDEIMMRGISEEEQKNMIGLFLRMQENLRTLLPERESEEKTVSKENFTE